MGFKNKFFLFLIFNFWIINVLGKKYTPDWDSLDTHPLPDWYNDAKVGIIIHWGVYSVPAFRNEWFWWSWKGWPEKTYIDFMKENYPPNYKYQNFAHDFKATFYDSDQWAQLFEEAGAKYVVLTAKHHEGFCLWPSKTSWNWNSMDIGPHRDILGELEQSIRNNTKLKFGIYHSLFEWFNPTFLQDEASLFLKKDFSQKKSMPELYDLVNTYKPDIVWSDGNWIGVDRYWNSTDFIAWLYNDSPVKETVVVNDRWGPEDPCEHGDIHTCHDRYNPGIAQKHKWENAMTLDGRSWGFRNNMKLSDVMSIEHLIKQMVETVSCGGNILINIGPTRDGVIVPIFEERLRQLGSWLNLNGEAIYKSRPWKHQNDTVNPDVWYTSNKDAVYAILLKHPENQKNVTIKSPKTTPSTTIELLGYAGKISWLKLKQTGLQIDLSYLKTFKKKTSVFKLKHVY